MNFWQAWKSVWIDVLQAVALLLLIAMVPVFSAGTMIMIAGAMLGEVEPWLLGLQLLGTLIFWTILGATDRMD